MSAHDAYLLLAAAVMFGFGVGFGVAAGVFACARWFGPLRIDRGTQTVHQYWHDGPPPGENDPGRCG